MKMSNRNPFKPGDKVRRKPENRGEFAWDGGDDIFEVSEVFQDGKSIKLKGSCETWFGPKFDMVDTMSLDAQIADLEKKLAGLRDQQLN